MTKNPELNPRWHCTSFQQSENNDFIMENWPKVNMCTNLQEHLPVIIVANGAAIRDQSACIDIRIFPVYVFHFQLPCTFSSNILVR